MAPKSGTVVAEENEFILYATRYSIHRYDLASGVSEELPLAGLRGAVALDFDYEHNCLYWADVTLDIIQVSHEQGGITSLPPGCCIHTLKCKYLSWYSSPPSCLSPDLQDQAVPHLFILIILIFFFPSVFVSTAALGRK